MLYPTEEGLSTPTCVQEMHNFIHGGEEEGGTTFSDSSFARLRLPWAPATPHLHKQPACGHYNLPLRERAGEQFPYWPYDYFLIKVSYEALNGKEG
jgi:hypothetical protein